MNFTNVSSLVDSVRNRYDYSPIEAAKFEYRVYMDVDTGYVDWDVLYLGNPISNDCSGMCYCCTIFCYVPTEDEILEILEYKYGQYVKGRIDRLGEPI